MRSFFLIVLAACLLLTPAARAQLDPDPDNVGIFFDVEATVNCADVYLSTVECYITIVAPSEPSGVGGMEAYFELAPSLIFMGLDCPGEIILPPIWPEFQVFLTEPLPATPVVLICSFNVFVMDPTPAFLTIHDAAYYAGDDPEQVIPLDPVTHYDADGNPNPVAGINVGAELCPLNNEGSTWGGLKALYH
jgi:hypothetical protein